MRNFILQKLTKLILITSISVHISVWIMTCILRNPCSHRLFRGIPPYCTVISIYTYCRLRFYFLNVNVLDHSWYNFNRHIGTSNGSDGCSLASVGEYYIKKTRHRLYKYKLDGSKLVCSVSNGAPFSFPGRKKDFLEFVSRLRMCRLKLLRIIIINPDIDHRCA